MQIELNHLGIIAISGEDALSFLQGQFTCDVTKVNTQHSILGTYCNPQGLVQATFRLLQWKNAYLLILDKDLMPSVLETLKKYGLFSRVTIQSITPISHKGLIEKGQYKPYLERHALYPTEQDAVCYTTSTCVICVNAADPDAMRLEYMCFEECTINLDFKSKFPKLDDALNTWLLEDIKQGIVHLPLTTSYQFTPQVLAYDKFPNAVSFQKGCYMGQEIIARIHYKGKVKQHVYSGKAVLKTKPMQPGMKLHTLDQEEAGMILSTVPYEKNSHYVQVVLEDKIVDGDKYINLQELEMWLEDKI